MHESSNLELKETPSKSFLKTVSAFANYGTGRIVFGVTDDGLIQGLAYPAETKLAIENAINDSLDPRPRFSLETEQREGKSVVVLTVFEGLDKPYLCSGKAYRRMDTATVPVDRAELRCLAIEGSPRSFDEMDSPRQSYTFETLSHWLRDELHIDGVTEEVLVTLGLYRDGRFNNAAAILADENDMPGMDIVRYAADEVSIHQRMTYEGVSALTLLEEAVASYRANYCVERVQGMERRSIALIPETSFREALANALVHRLWYVDARINVSMFQDRVEIMSPGGLPSGIDESLYLEGGISIPRNTTLAYIFLRLGVIERLGTGIRSIRRAYEGLLRQPTFDLSQHAIKVTLPTCEREPMLSEDERRLLDALELGSELSSSELSDRLGVSRSTIIRLLSNLEGQNIIQRVGRGRATRYHRV